MKSKAILVTGVDRVEVADTTVPDPAGGEVMVEALYTAISPGTELRCVAGKQPGAVFPFVPGYSMVGRISARGPGVSIAEGTMVFCSGTEKAGLPLLWGGHIGHAVKSEASVFPLPEGVDPLEAALAKLAAIAYRGVRIAGTRPHEDVAVVGLGAIGQLAARLHRLAGARVVAADVDPARVAIAESAGIAAFGSGPGLLSGFRSLQPLGADVVVDATGAAALLRETVLLARQKPYDDSLTEPVRLVVQGSYPGDISFDYHQAFFRELTMLFPRDNQPRDLRAVLGFLASGRLRIKDLISRVGTPSQAGAFYSGLRASEPGLLTAAIQWMPLS